MTIPSLPWTWTGGYPQRITCPDATLVAEVYENPDAPAVIAPLICDAVNAYFGVDASRTYDERPQRVGWMDGDENRHPERDDEGAA